MCFAFILTLIFSCVSWYEKGCEKMKVEKVKRERREQKWKIKNNNTGKPFLPGAPAVPWKGEGV